MKRIWILSAFCFLLATPIALAQDMIRLLDGPLLRGEVIQESPKAVKMIDTMGKVHVVQRDKIKRLRIGRGLKKKTLEKLASVKDKSEASLWAIVAWCAEQKALKRDSQRLARRVLVMNPEHAEARKLLGHVKALGTWYANQEEAFKAVETKMTEAGYVFASGGWIRTERAADLAANPAAWLLIDDFKWRPLADVMRERGFEKYLEAWYPRDQKHLIPEAKALSKAMEAEFHIGQVGSSRVLTVETREDAIEIATSLDKVRKWFGKTFEVKKHGDRRDLETNPMNRAIVLSDKEQLVAFGDKFKEKYQFTDSQLKYERALNQALWSPLSHAHAMSDVLWKNQLPSQLGGNLLKWYFVKQEGLELPPWMWVASAHLGEIEATGVARVPYIAPSNYGQVETKENRGTRSLTDARDRVKEQNGASLRGLMGKPFNALTPEDDVAGMVYFTFLLEKYKPQLLKFLTARPCGNLFVRFKKFFSKPMEEFDHEFKEWL